MYRGEKSNKCNQCNLRGWRESNGTHFAGCYAALTHSLPANQPLILLVLYISAELQKIAANATNVILRHWRKGSGANGPTLHLCYITADYIISPVLWREEVQVLQFWRKRSIKSIKWHSAPPNHPLPPVLEVLWSPVIFLKGPILLRSEIDSPWFHWIYFGHIGFCSHQWYDFIDNIEFSDMLSRNLKKTELALVLEVFVQGIARGIFARGMARGIFAQGMARE